MYLGRMTSISRIAGRIETARIGAGRSIAWLAIAAGIPDKTLRRRLKNPSQFTLSELSAIATALDVTLDEVFSAEDQAVAA